MSVPDPSATCRQGRRRIEDTTRCAGKVCSACWSTAVIVKNDDGSNGVAGCAATAQDLLTAGSVGADFFSVWIGVDQLAALVTRDVVRVVKSSSQVLRGPEIRGLQS